MRPPWARGHHHGHHRHGRPPRLLMLAFGIRRRLIGFLVLAAGLGIGATLAFHAALAHGSGPGALLGLGAAALLAVWVVSWVATFVIARPLRHLAEVAGEIHDGKLQSRDRLPTGRDEVGEVGDALRAMTERVAKQLADQRALMAAVSHELRSPLGRARVLIEMLREGSAPASAHDDLQAEIDAMDGLVGDLLAAARIDFEAVSPQPLDALDVARRAIELAQLPPATLRTAASPGTVRADPTLIARALSGLLDNARRYGAKTITLSVVEDAEQLRFVVDDDGPGFAPGEEEQAFQPFWRGPAVEGSTRPRGEGLGLALVRQIAQAHGGTAGAERPPGGGARVWVALPR